MLHYPHPGIRIDEIHVEGAGGLIFVLGITGIFLTAVPAFIPYLGASILAGLLLAPVLHHFAH